MGELWRVALLGSLSVLGLAPRLCCFSHCVRKELKTEQLVETLLTLSVRGSSVDDLVDDLVDSLECFVVTESQFIAPAFGVGFQPLCPLSMSHSFTSVAIPVNPCLDTVPCTRAIRPFVENVVTHSLAIRHCVARPQKVVERLTVQMGLWGWIVHCRETES